MKKKIERKLTLSRESLPHLAARDLEEVRGGFPVDDDTDGSGLTSELPTPRG